jgi:hypothetical protein
MGLLAATSFTAIAAHAAANRPADAVTPATVPTVFMPISPIRVLDTRPAPYGPIGVPTAAKIGPGAQLDLTLAGSGAAVPADATAAMINVTIDQDSTMGSYLTIWPKGETRPNTSANNALPGLIASNSMVAKLGDGGISIYNQQGSINLVIDVVGYLLPMSDAGIAGNFIVGAGAPQATTGSDGDYYLDATNHDLYGPKTGDTWPGPDSLIGPRGLAGQGGILGGVSRYSEAALSLPNITTTGVAIPFTTSGLVFGSFDVPTTPATATTITVGATGVYEVTYRLDVATTGAGTIQVYDNDTPEGPGTSLATILTTEASDTVLLHATAGDEIQLRFTGALGLLTSTNSSSLIVTQIG